MKNKKVIPRLPSGFNELLPNQQVVFEFMKAEISRTYSSLGYSPIETSNIELTEVLLARGGGETEKQVYRFTKGKNDLMLRYDLTVPMARYIAQNYSNLTFPFKRYQMQKVWRAEKAQKGRSREFYQCDVDVLGNISTLADVDTVFAVYTALKNIGTPDFTIYINNRKLILSILSNFSLQDSYLPILGVVDKVNKIGKDSTLELLIDITKDSKKSLNLLNILSLKGSFTDISNKIKELDLKDIEGLKELKELYENLLNLGVEYKNLRIDLSIVRGLDYYTSSVFETYIDGFEKYGSIASGGRYDELASNYINQNIPGVGMSIGLTRLFDILDEMCSLPLVKGNFINLIICYLSEEVKTYALESVECFRKAGLNATIYLGQNLSLNKQLDYANKLEIPYVVIVGEDEVKNKIVTLKNMSTGKQEFLSLDKVIKILKN